MGEGRGGQDLEGKVRSREEGLTLDDAETLGLDTRYAAAGAAGGGGTPGLGSDVSRGCGVTNTHTTPVLHLRLTAGDAELHICLVGN